jgi:hypothetical protein
MGARNRTTGSQNAHVAMDARAFEKFLCSSLLRFDDEVRDAGGRRE